MLTIILAFLIGFIFGMALLGLILIYFTKPKKFEPEIDLYIDEKGEITPKDRADLERF